MILAVYTEKFSLSDGVFVALFTGDSTSEEDYALHLEGLEHFASEATRTTGLVLVDMAATHEAPPAPWRRRLGAIKAARPMVVAVVTPSAILRGMVTAILWMRAVVKDDRTVTFASADQALAGLEKEAGRPLARLRQLHADARQAAASQPSGRWPTSKSKMTAEEKTRTG